MALKLSGFVCTFTQAAPGLNPKHTIYAFINFKLELWRFEKTKTSRKRGRDWSTFKKRNQLVQWLWWWSSGQRALLLRLQSKFASRWGLKFLMHIIRKRTVVGVNVVAIYSYNPSSNPAKPTLFVLNFVFEKEQKETKRSPCTWLTFWSSVALDRDSRAPACEIIDDCNVGTCHQMNCLNACLLALGLKLVG